MMEEERVKEQNRVSRNVRRRSKRVTRKEVDEIERRDRSTAKRANRCAVDAVAHGKARAMQSIEVKFRVVLQMLWHIRRP
jgi:hypothetical protein